MLGDSTDSVTSSSIVINDNTTVTNGTGYQYHGGAVTVFGFWTLKLIRGRPVAKELLKGVKGVFNKKIF